MHLEAVLSSPFSWVQAKFNEGVTALLRNYTLYSIMHILKLMRNRINGPYNINDHKPSYELEVG